MRQLLIPILLCAMTACGSAAAPVTLATNDADAPAPTLVHDDGIAIIDYRATEANEAAAAKVLSDAGIRFRIETVPSGGWSPRVERLAITVAHADVARADALLRNADLDAVPDIDDLRARY